MDCETKAQDLGPARRMRKGIAEAEIGAGDAGDKEGDLKKDEGDESGHGRHRAEHCTMVRCTAGCATVPPIEVLAFSRAAYGSLTKRNSK